MKFKLGCASAVLMFLSFDMTQGGALKNSFRKAPQNEETKADTETSQERPQIESESKEETPAKEESKEEAKNEKNEKSEVSHKVTPPEEKKKIVGNPVIFRIGQKEIHRDEILEDMKMLPAQLVQGTSPDKLFDLLKQQKLISYLVVEQAKKAGMDRTKEYMDQLGKLKDRLLFETYLLKEIGPKTENEPALKAKYQKYLIEFKGGKEVKLAHISVNSEKDAKEIVDALSKGTSFEKLQKEKSTSPAETSDRYFPLAAVPEDIRGKLSALNKGDYTKEAIKIADGYHIFKLLDSRDMKPGSYEEVKPMLAQLIMKEEMDKLISKLEKQYSVERFNEDGTPEKK